VVNINNKRIVHPVQKPENFFVCEKQSICTECVKGKYLLSGYGIGIHVGILLPKQHILY